MKFKSSSGCIGLNSVCLHVGVGIYKQICRGSPSDCESVREIFHPPLAEADPAKPCISHIDPTMQTEQSRKVILYLNGKDAQ